MNTTFPNEKNKNTHMKYTKTRKGLSCMLAAALSLSLAMSAFAAPPAKPDGGFGAPPSGGFGAPGGKPGGSSSASWSGVKEITSALTESDGSYSSSSSDQNAVLISTADQVALVNPTVTKTGDSDGGDNTSFYGTNAAVMVKGGGTASISGGTITTAANGANAVFSYGGNGAMNGAGGDGTTVHLANTVITTTGNGSGGIMTTGGGIMIADDLTVETSGGSSAPIRTDRGGGTVTVNRGSYISNGLGSPAVYSTADVTVNDAVLESRLSEGVCIEGKNSVTFNNVTLTANNTQMNGHANFLDSIMIYQSMSGDADSGTSFFRMNGGTLNSLSGHVFHVTNTNAEIDLCGVAINNTDAAQVLLSVCADGWNGGSNIATLNTAGQVLNGNILVGSDSTLTMNLTAGSAFTGAISGSITNAKGNAVSASAGTVNVTLDDSSTWSLTGDTYISSFSGNAANVTGNGYTLYVNGTPLGGIQ